VHPCFTRAATVIFLSHEAYEAIQSPTS
jgi:hypothetical protein